MSKIDGQVALVTGAGRGIGRGIARTLAAEGAAVALAARTASQLEDLAREIREAGGTALVLPLDVTDRAAVEAGAARVAAELGPISFLVNNAGVDKPWGPIGAADPDEWWQAQNVHVRGALLFMHAVLPQMQQAGRGRIVNMASAAAQIVGPNTSAYCVAKATLVRLTEHVDAEQKDSGIRAFTGHPGTLATDMLNDTLADADAARYAPHLIDFLQRFREIDTTNEEARLAMQMVAVAAGDHDDAAGRYIDFEQEFRPAGFGPPPELTSAV